MKDVTSTTFGLIIAFLLPGIVVLLALSYWIPPLKEVFITFNSAQSNVGLFLLVVLVGIALSLQITILRWALYEKLICRKIKLQPDDFSGLAQESKLIAFRAAVEENYRFHQFWGAMSIIIPIIIFGWGNNLRAVLSCEGKIIFWISLSAIEILTIVAARQAYVNYVVRSKSILKEPTMPNGWREDKKEESSKRERFKESDKPPKPDTSRKPDRPATTPSRDKPKKDSK